MLRPVLGFIVVLLFLSCSTSPQKIEYGKDQCSFCVMNIVDNSHSAQYVTKKGKQYKFDAIECMVRDIIDKGDQELATVIVADYGNPGIMIDAYTAAYLISPEINSPMGANLSALSTEEKAMELMNSHTGTIHAWEALIEKFTDK